jgi:drug/metabolite transporter (DMT)-like permease
VLLAGTFWSIAGVILRNVEVANAWQIVFYRSGTGAITMAIVLVLKYGAGAAAIVRQAGWAGVLGGAVIGYAYIATVLALLNTTVASALFIFAASPFFAAALGWLVLRERVHAHTWITIAVALAGVGIMVADGIGGALFGNLMAVTMALAFASVAVIMRYGRRFDMLPAVFMGGLFSALVALPLAGTIIIPISDMLLCVTLGVVQISFGMIAFTAGSRYVPAAQLGLLAMTESVFGPVWVWLFVGEFPSLLTIVGGAAVLGAIVAQSVLDIRRKSI